MDSIQKENNDVLEVTQLTKERVALEFERMGKLQYEYQSGFYRKSVYDLYLTIGNIGYRVATYSVKTRRVILICPEIHIPQASVIEKFIEYVNKKGEKK